MDQIQAQLAAQDLKAQGLVLPLEVARRPAVLVLPQVDEIALPVPSPAPGSLSQTLLSALSRTGPSLPRW